MKELHRVLCALASCCVLTSAMSIKRFEEDSASNIMKIVRKGKNNADLKSNYESALQEARTLMSDPEYRQRVERQSQLTFVVRPGAPPQQNELPSLSSNVTDNPGVILIQVPAYVNHSYSLFLHPAQNKTSNSADQNDFSISQMSSNHDTEHHLMSRDDEQNEPIQSPVTDCQNNPTTIADIENADQTPDDQTQNNEDYEEDNSMNQDIDSNHEVENEQTDNNSFNENEMVIESVENSQQSEYPNMDDVNNQENPNNDDHMNEEMGNGVDTVTENDDCDEDIDESQDFPEDSQMENDHETNENNENEEPEMNHNEHPMDNEEEHANENSEEHAIENADENAMENGDQHVMENSDEPAMDIDKEQAENEPITTDQYDEDEAQDVNQNEEGDGNQSDPATESDYTSDEPENIPVMMNTTPMLEHIDNTQYNDNNGQESNINESFETNENDNVDIENHPENPVENNDINENASGDNNDIHDNIPGENYDVAENNLENHQHDIAPSPTHDENNNFDEENQNTLEQSEVSTATSEIVNPMTVLKESCLEPTGQFASPNSCRKYVNCWEGTPFEHDCPADLLFNDVGGFCDWKHKVDCGNRPISEPHVEGCNGNKNSVFRNPDDCSEYFVCVTQEEPMKFKCPEGLHYNDKIGVCDHRHRVDCGTSPPPRANKNGNGKTRAPPGIVSSNVFCKPDYLWKIGRGCRQVDICSAEGHVQQVRCPTLTAFDSKARKCIYEGIASC